MRRNSFLFPAFVFHSNIVVNSFCYSFFFVKRKNNLTCTEYHLAPDSRPVHWSYCCKLCWYVYVAKKISNKAAPGGSPAPVGAIVMYKSIFTALLVQKMIGRNIEGD